MTHGSGPRPGPRRSPRGPRTPRRRTIRSLRGPSLVRLRIGFLLIAMIVSVFAARLFQLQGVDAQAYVAKAKAEGVVTVTLPGQPRRDHRPQRRPARRLGRRADAGRGPDDDRDSTRARSPRSSPGGCTWTTSTCSTRLRKPYTHFQYIARRIPATKARAVVDAIDAKGYQGIDTRRDPVRSYPGNDIGANLVGFMNAEGDAAEGAELTVRQAAGRQGRLGDVRGGRRQPDPARREQHHAGPQRERPHAHHRPRRAVVHPAGAPLRRRGARRQLRLRRGDGHPHRRAAGARRLPDVRRQRTRPSRRRRTSVSRALRDVYEPGSVEKVLTARSLIDAGKVTPDTKITVPGPAAQCRTG